MNSLNNEYKQWLATLGYADSSVKSMPSYINELLIFIGNTAITNENINNYFEQFKLRNNKTRSGGLSANHINKTAVAINNFIQFLNVTNKARIDLKLKGVSSVQKMPSVLSKNDIEKLYNATYNSNKAINNNAYGQRDRTMLALYYGCGLRKNEGLNIKIDDIDFKHKTLLVQKGKGNKERFVPIAQKGLQDIEEYLNDGRKYFLGMNSSTTSYLLISVKGQALKCCSARLELLKEEANISKPLSLHTLRHSIATHLLQNGMEIDYIKRFLGHSTLDSTQLYTHIVNDEL
jgi:integrase/recombinase XerD